MAKVTGGLFSLTASGNIGELIVFSTSKGTQTVKGNRLELNSDFYFRNKKGHSQTLKQLAVRDTFREAIKQWNNSSMAVKQIYKDAAKKVKNTAVGIFIKDFINEYLNQSEYKHSWLWSVGAGQSLYMMNNSNSIGALMGVAMHK